MLTYLALQSQVSENMSKQAKRSTPYVVTFFKNY